MVSTKLITIREAANRLGLKESTIRKYILKRQIAYVKPSVRAVRIPIEELERILAAARSDNDDGHIGKLTNALQSSETIQDRHHNIQKDQVWMFFDHHIYRLLPVGSLEDMKPLSHQVCFHEA